MIFPLPMPGPDNSGDAPHNGYPRFLQYYRATFSAANKLSLGLEACLNGFWLGVLTEERLAVIDQYYYDQKSQYHSPEYNKSGLKKWENSVIEEHFLPGSNLLLIGAGGGREVRQLLKNGFSVTAFECNAELTRVANELLTAENLDAEVLIAPRDECPETHRRYGGAIVGWGAYTHIQTREKRVRLLGQIRAQLESNAPMLISFWCRTGSNARLTFVNKIANAFRFFLRRSPIEVGDDINVNFVHYFTEDEIRFEMNEAGFDVVSFSRRPYGHAVGRTFEVR